MQRARFDLKWTTPSMASRGAALCFSSSSAAVTSSSRRGGCRREPLRFLVVSCDTRAAAADVYSSLAAKILGPPTTFNAAKLKVEFAGEEMTRSKKQPFPQVYTLTHCDFTANLTLAVTTSEQLRSWQSTLQRDDFVAEWKEEVAAAGEMTLQCIAMSAAPTSCRSSPPVSDTTSSPKSYRRFSRRWFTAPRRCLRSGRS